LKALVIAGLLASTTAHADIVQPQLGTPPLEPGNVVTQVVYGGGMSLLGGIVGTGVAFARCKQAGNNQTTGEECLDDIVVGSFIGGSLAFSFGVFLGGDTPERTGSILATLGGGFAGAALGGAGAYLLRDSPGAVATLLIVPTVVGSVVGFNLTRRWRQPMVPMRVGSLLHVDGERVSLGIPLIVPGETGATGSLFSGRF
jgi:hypothetical protein